MSQLEKAVTAEINPFRLKADYSKIENEDCFWFTLINGGQSHIAGSFWTLSLRISNQVHNFAFPMKILRKSSQWRLKLNLNFSPGLQDFPIPLEASLVFNARNGLKVQCKPWLKTELLSLDFLQVKSSLLGQDLSADNAAILHQTGGEDSFEAFLSKFNATERPFFDKAPNDTISIVANVKSEALQGDLKAPSDTVYADFLGASVSVHFEAGRVTLRGHDLEPLVRLKQDILARYSSSQVGMSKDTLLALCSLVEDSITDDDESCDKLQSCYKMLRQL